MGACAKPPKRPNPARRRLPDRDLAKVLQHHKALRRGPLAWPRGGAAMVRSLRPRLERPGTSSGADLTRRRPAELQARRRELRRRQSLHGRSATRQPQRRRSLQGRSARRAALGNPSGARAARRGESRRGRHRAQPRRRQRPQPTASRTRPADLSSARARGADFSYAQFTGAIIANADLSDAQPDPSRSHRRRSPLQPTSPAQCSRAPISAAPS